MSKRRTIELANLVVLFGGRGLVDNFRDRFMPVIKDGRVSGKGEVESYRFHAIDFLTTDGHPIMYGRLLKFMNIEAEQDYDENEEELVESNRVIPSVPSSFFGSSWNSGEILRAFLPCNTLWQQVLSDLTRPQFMT